MKIRSFLRTSKEYVPAPAMKIDHKTLNEKAIDYLSDRKELVSHIESSRYDVSWIVIPVGNYNRICK